MLPSVCIIIPTYNQAAFINRAVSSALAQTYSNLQILVADDGSTDATRDILQPHLQGQKVQYRRNPSNVGRVRNYHQALHHHTTAKWVVNLDGDDYFINDDFIAEAVKAIQEQGEEQVLFFQGAHETRGDQPQALKPNRPIASEALTVLNAREYFFGFFDRKSFSHLTTLYRRDAAMRSGFYEFDTLSSDMYSVLLLCLNNLDMRVILSKKESAVWYQHAANSSKSVSAHVHLQNFRLLSELPRLARERGQGWARCLAWRAGLARFYALLYAGALWRKVQAQRKG